MESKSFYDRANFFVTAQALFVNAFAALVVSSNLIGLFKYLPVIICLIGIALNVAWIYSSFVSQDVKNLVNTLNLKDIIYKAAPIILGVGWTALLIAFVLQAFGIVKIAI